MNQNYHDSRVAKAHNRKHEATSILRRLSPLKSAARISGLLTRPELAANAYRLEQIVEDILCFSSGDKRISDSEITSLFNIYGKLPPGMMEDPSEDIFIGLVYFRGKNYRIFEGLWEANSFSLQRLLEAVETMPDTPPYREFIHQVTSMLSISEMIAQRCSLKRYADGATYPVSSLARREIVKFSSSEKFVTLKDADLSSIGTTRHALGPFLVPINQVRAGSENRYKSILTTRPIVTGPDYLLVSIPSCISTAIRYRILDFLDRCRIIDEATDIYIDRYISLMHNTRLLGTPAGALLRKSLVESVPLFEGVQAVDEGRYIHYVFIVDTFRGYKDGFVLGESSSINTAFEGILEHSVDVQRRTAKNPGFKGGITLMVICGWGRGGLYPLPESDISGWKTHCISADQLLSLSSYPGIDPMHIFRMDDHLEKLEQKNISILNFNGLVNLYGLAVEQGFHLVPHSSISADMLQSDKPLLLFAPNEQLLTVRKRAAQSHDIHMALPSESNPVLVSRYSPNPYFAEDETRPLYGSVTDMLNNDLRSLYEGARISLWLTVATNENKDADASVRLWDAFTKWMPHIVPLYEKYIEQQTDITINWHMNFEVRTNVSSFDYEGGVNGLYNIIEMSIDSKRKRVQLDVPEEVFLAFSDPSNIVERAILMRLSEGVSKLTDTEMPIIQIVNQATINERARQFHLFNASSFQDIISSQLPRHPVSLESFDDTLARIGVAFRAGGLVADTMITGIDRCTKALNKIVDSLWVDIRNQLQSLNRQDIIEKLLINIVCANKDSRQWQRTIRALLELYGDKSKTLKIASERIFKNNLTVSSCRYAIEMALCESPTNAGSLVGKLEMSRLMSYIQLMCQYGGWSDGIRLRAIPDKIEVTSLGLLAISGDFHDRILVPYGLEMEADRFMYHAQQYSNINKSPEYSDTMRTILGAEFMDLWALEFGFGIDEAKQFMDNLDDIAIDQKSPIVTMTRRELEAVIGKSMPKNQAKNFLDEFSLRPRDSWDQPSSGFHMSDIVPWRFKRRLSLVCRPILSLEKDDNSYVLSPEIVRQGFSLRVSRVYGAEYDDQSYSTKGMKIWTGSQRNRLGHEFTQDVYEKMCELGWICRCEVEVPELVNENMDRDYGDVDVLAWNPRGGRVLIIECKNLFVAKTPGEVARQLSEFRGERSKSGKPDRLLRHMERVDILRKKRDRLSQFTRCAIEKIESVLVFRHLVPLEYSRQEQLAGIKIHYPHTLDQI